MVFRWLLCILLAMPPLARAAVIAGPVTNPANGHTYYLLDAASWTTSEADAVSLGGHLVAINDAAEDAWVYSTFDNYGGVHRTLWIGLNDAAQEGTFVWSNGDPVTYTNWASGEPNNANGVEDHVQIICSLGSGAGRWNDLQDAGANTACNPSVDPSGVVEVSDADGDGVSDPQDQCPNTPGGEAVDALGCSCSQKTCDDDDSCTVDSCGASAGCAHQWMEGCCHIDADCHDGNLCNGIETCSADTCIPGSPQSPCDSDGDGVADQLDICPAGYDPRQRDRDADAHGVACDNCPYTANSTQDDADGDGIGDDCEPTLTPTIGSVRPPEAVINSRITIRGRNFGPFPGTGHVSIGAQLATVADWTDRSLTVIVPPVQEGPNDVQVQTDAGSSGTVSLLVIDLVKRTDAHLRQLRKTMLEFPIPSQDWRTLAVLQLGFRSTKYDTLYMLGVNRRNLALNTVEAAQGLLRDERFDEVKRYNALAVTYLIQSNELFNAADLVFRGAVQDVSNVLNAIYQVSTATLAAVGRATCGYPCAEVIAWGLLQVDYMVDKALAGEDEAEKNKARNLAFRVLFASSGFASSPVSAYLDKPTTQYIGKSGLYQTIHGWISSRAFEVEMLRLAAAEGVQLNRELIPVMVESGIRLIARLTTAEPVKR